MGEEERDESQNPGATRSQHVVLTGSADSRTIAAALRPGAERSRTQGAPGAPATLIVTPTVEQAAQAARQMRALLGDAALRVVPVSAVARARRLLLQAPVAAVAGTAHDLLALRRDAALRMEDVKAIAIIGLDEILGEAEGAALTLETLLADAPVDAMRIATLEQESGDVEAFLESHVRRARRITTSPVVERTSDFAPKYAITSEAGRLDALRAILDALDPPSLVVVASTDTGLQEARAALLSLGVVIDDLLVRVTRDAPASHVALVVFWDAPHAHEALERALTARPIEAIALLLPDEVPAFRRMAGGAVEAWTAPARREGAESRARQLRTALRSTLANGAGASASELSLLAPLLDSHDALEIAAAALRLYEGARREVLTLKSRVQRADAGQPSSSRTSGAPGRQRLFLAVGKRDEVRVGDIVGAIANEAGIPGERIGQVELFESHAIVDLSAEDATIALEALANATLRGRRLGARIDDRAGAFGGPRRSPDRERGDRPERGPRAFDRGDRTPRLVDRGDRPARGFARGERSEGGERPPRTERREPRPMRDGGDRGDSRGPSRGPARGAGGPPRGSTGEARRGFGDRPMRERTESRNEWSERGERMQRARRPLRNPPTTPDADDVE